MTQRNSENATILIIDDEEQIRGLLKELLRVEYECTDVASAEAALAVLSRKNFDLVISDINMDKISGLDLVPQILKSAPDTVVVMISGQATIDYAIEAMRAGAFDYITKPLDLRHVENAVRRALSHHQLLADKRRYENHLEDMVKERTAEIEHLAYYDRLTDLPNRNLFADRCAKAIVVARNRKQLMGVILVSLDRFKNINDTLGHAAGDQLLKEVAVRLQRCVSGADTIARFEGPQFAILLTQPVDSSTIEAVSVSIIESLKASFDLPAQEVYLTPSIGISLFPLN